jgi:hypothetical protein
MSEDASSAFTDITLYLDPVSVIIFGQMTRTAYDLNYSGQGPCTASSEYVRGQAELICNAFGLCTDDYREAVTALITGERDVRIRYRQPGPYSG